jgi:hypothetical protein
MASWFTLKNPPVCSIAHSTPLWNRGLNYSRMFRTPVTL